MGLREMYLAKRGCYKLEIGGPNPAIVHEAVVVTLVVYIGFGAQGSSKGGKTKPRHQRNSIAGHVLNGS